MTIPIQIGGVRRGTLETRAEGPYTAFSARCAAQGVEGVQRLWVFGGGKSACLGVLLPENGTLTLRRKLSRAALHGFPERIEYAALSADAPQEQAQEEEKHEKTASYEKAAPHGAWSEQPDGSLVLTENGVRLLALPCALRRVPPGLDLREIAGSSYLVFRY